MDRTDILNTYATDMAAVESHIATAVGDLLENAEAKNYPRAVSVLTTLKTTMEGHVTALEAYNDRTEDGDLKEAAKEALGDAPGFAAGLWNKIRNKDEVSRSVRDTYTATGLAAISYHMLYTTALGLKDHALADLALRNLKDITPLIGQLSEVVCTVVAAELTAEDKMIGPTVGQQAVEATQKAWRQAG